VHYSAYERRVLEGLAAAVPELATAISKVTSRLFDLEAVVRAHTKHPEAAGRTSIKYVLPAWCDDLSYAGLGIRDGQTASTRYFKAITGRLTDADACAAVFDDLEVYCGLDTLAMVRLLDRLRELAAG
jgi:predicted RecB family nuclease